MIGTYSLGLGVPLLLEVLIVFGFPSGIRFLPLALGSPFWD